MGTKFTVYLPRHESEPGAFDHAATVCAQAGKGTVLLVDDEQSLARLGKKMLESLGYIVREITDPVEALRVFESDPMGFDVIFTDQTMPELTGVELTRRARLTRPGIPSVMCTGYSDLIDENSARSQGIDAFIHKPYDRAKLASGTAMALSMEKKST